MTDRRGRTALLAVPIALLLAGCASAASVDGRGSLAAAGSTSGSTSGAASSSSGAASSSSGSGVSKETLAAQLHQGVASVRSAHFSLRLSAAGENITAAGDERLSSGKLTAMKLTENLPGAAGSLSLVLVDGKTYVKLPAALSGSTGKPWTLATRTSSNPVVRQLAQSLDSTLSSASVGSVGAFADTAKSVSTVGTETIAGVPATHLHVVVDVKKLAARLPGGSGEALDKAGLTEFPLDMWLDGQHRPVQIVESLTVGGQKVYTKVSLGRYNDPVTIVAPPASQVGH